MASTVVLSRTFATSNVTFSQIKVMDSGAKQAYVNYEGGKFLFQTPALTIPYGMSTFDKAGPIKYSIDLSLRGYDEAGSKTKEFYDALHSLDEYMIEQGVKHSKAWFKSDLKPDIVRAFYTPIVRWGKDKDGNVKPYPPTVKLSLKKNGESFDVKMFDGQVKPPVEYEGIPVEDLLVKGAILRAVMQCTGIWFAGGKFGLSWKAAQIVMDKVPEGVRGYAFVDDAEDDAVFSTPTPAPSSALAAVMPLPPTVAPPAEEDEDMDDAPEDAEPIPLPIAKKVVPLGGAGPAKPAVVRKVVKPTK